MRQDEVPQDKGMAGGLQEVCYAVDEEGRYILAASSGWEPKNIANSQAWELIATQITEVKRQIKAGKISMLALYMAKNQMDISLLAKYTGIWRWRIKRHLKPKVFAGLPPAILARYAEIFKITSAELTNIAALDAADRPNIDEDTDAD